MQIYKSDGFEPTLEEVDHNHSGAIAHWLQWLFPQEYQSLVLGYYSLLLHEEISPSEAVKKTLEVMGPAYIQGPYDVAESINNLRQEMADWFSILRSNS